MEDLFMELLIVALFSLFVGHNVPLTQVHQDCLRGDKSACEVEKKINPYVEKK